jgi:hypothetical protein
MRELGTMSVRLRSNTGSAADGWKECTYDHREGTCVRFFLYERKDGNVGRVSAWSPWYSTSTGNRC